MIVHYAHTRGSANYCWLEARHTFSFTHYYDPERMNFGALRVLNDDTIAPRKGFPTHAHQDMEIITIPLQGRLAHEDSQGHSSIITAGEVQVMSAGTGIAHSEYNASQTEHLNLLQIWVLPRSLGLPPRYDQKAFDQNQRHNRWQCVVSPDGQEGSLMIQQEAYFYLTELQEGQKLDYAPHVPHHGIYLFLIYGSLQVQDLTLNTRDGVGLTQGPVSFKALKTSEVLLIEVPMLDEVLS